MATNTAASFTNHTGNGSTANFSISFSYLSINEIDVTVDGQSKTINTHFTISGSSLTFTSGNIPANGAAIKIQRDTDISSKKVDFEDGSVLTEADLDANSDQILFGLQEFVDELNNNVVKKDGGLAQITDAANLAALTDNERLILDGATVSTTELNTLDGVNSTLTASELNVLDGITASTSNLNQLTNKEVETSLTANSDAKIPTSKAVNDRILTVTNALGGFVAIANETSFPSTHPDPSSNAGTVVSISDAGGVVVNSSGVATITNGAGTGNTVTINSFPSDLHSKTLGSGVGLQVQTTTTLHTYTYHKVLLKESDLINLSNDIDDFGNRYRVVDTTPTSNNDEGDLIFRKSDNKLLVFNGTAYQEASSVGNFHTNTLSSFNGTGGGSATFNGSAYRFNINHPPELAEQLLVSINGVIQKPNNGSSQPSEGFALSGSSVIFSAAPASGSDFFIITIGKSVDIGTPSDGVITNAKVASDASIEGTKINPNFGSQNIITSGTVDGRDVSADGTKLDGIESNATADQTKSDIDALGIAASTAATLANARTIAGTSFDGSANIDISYTNLTNKLSVGDGGLTQNNFTDALKTKLDGVETGATADQTAAEIKTLLNSDGIVNAQIDASAAIDGSKISPVFTSSISTTGSVLITGSQLTFSNNAGGKIRFLDTNNNPDYEILSSQAVFQISQSSNDPIIKINSNKHIDLKYNVDCEAGLDVTGAITGTADATINSVNIGKGANSVSGNTVLGEDALDAAVTGQNNVAIGKNVLGANTSGQANTAVGFDALEANTTGQRNTAIGAGVLDAANANDNTGVGHGALGKNTSGERNTAVGKSALDENTTANNNTAVGYFALESNTTGTQNTAVGANALDANTTGSKNNAVGYNALTANTTGINNDAHGHASMLSNTSGSYNIAMGRASLDANTSGSNNIALGPFALTSNTTATHNVAIGYETLEQNTTGTQNVAVGSFALDENVDGSNNSAFGYASLGRNTSGDFNAAFGHGALARNTTANNNTAVGRDSLRENTTGINNVAVGAFSLDANQTGDENTALGTSALGANTASDNTAVGNRALFVNTTGAGNVAFGANALDANTSASNNTAVGYFALTSATTGDLNTAIGYNCMSSNQTADRNVAVGAQALSAFSASGDTLVTAVGFGAAFASTTAAQFVAVGGSSLSSQTTAAFNVAVGYNCMASTTTGGNNTAVGRGALFASQTGSQNVALGTQALNSNTASNNTAIGYQALTTNTTGTDNTATGGGALDANTTGSSNTVMGRNALGINTTGNQNTVLGCFSGDIITTGINNTVIGYNADPSSATVNNEITLGDSNISGLRCNVQTISSLSDARDKTNVIDLPEGLDFVTKLRPVKFEWATRDGNGKDGSYEHGFIAQDLQAAQKENDADYLNMVMDENPDRLEASYGKLVPILVKAIQELTIEVNKLKSNG